LDDVLEEHAEQTAAEAEERTDPERRAFIRRAFFVFLEKGHEIDDAWTLAYGAWQRKPEDC
jgi:hypothetical protein